MPPAGFPPLSSADGRALDRALLGEVAAALRGAGRAGLAGMSVAEIGRAVERAVVRWGDARSPERAGAAARLAEETGYHPAMVARALEDLPRAFRAPALERLLRRELGRPEALDGFVPAPGGRLERAFGPALTTVVLSGNVFHVAAESMILSLLCKSPCLVKASSRDRLFPLLFARSLAAADTRLGAALAVAWWPGGAGDLDAAAFAASDAVVAYGGAEAVAAVRARTPPDVRFVAHGPKLSFAVVGRGHTAGRHGRAAARAAARDVAMLDQQGCVSPHTIFVEGDQQEALGFARLLAGAMAGEERSAPRGRITAAEAARIQQARGAAEFRPGAELFADLAGTAWTVIFDREPAFAASCLNRVVHVKPLPDLTALPDALDGAAPFLQTVGVAGPPALREAIAELVGILGVARVCPLGRMQRPPADWRHDGRPRLLDVLRWTEVEQARAHRQAGGRSS